MDKNELHPDQQALFRRLLDTIFNTEDCYLTPMNLLTAQVYCTVYEYYSCILAPEDAKAVEAVELVENIFKEANLAIEYDPEVGLFTLIDKSKEAEKVLHNPYGEGVEAYIIGLPTQANPYHHDRETSDHINWLKGYSTAIKEYIEQLPW